MTPKEKAEELVERMTVHHWTDVCDFEGAKRCALVAVDEMMEVYASALVALGHSTKEAEAVESPYLKEVKQEIEKL